ncbi:hypothetical protein ZIOFF_035417 [Zingiber officinale]|uniref:RING-type domain-containing protein n=2 Tax=Zingiber officinale TaxID=94328 RepID=A0A8J5L2N4_ZINOF|nr:hypothetical protein ZIOFF_035417 [Zingiber officinale]
MLRTSCSLQSAGEEGSMALQSQQHPSNCSFLMELRSGAAAVDELRMMQELRQLLDDAAVDLSDPQSELTCNASAMRTKRPREEAAADDHLDCNQFFGFVSPVAPFCDPSSLSAVVGAGCEQSHRLGECEYPSTSGRPAAFPLSRDLASLLCQQTIEIDALLRLQTERMRSGLEETQRRHLKALVWGVEQRAAKRLREKEVELEKARQQNAELEERVRQASAETQMWVTVAKNNETVAASLRASLDQALLQIAAAAQVKEGYGDTEDDDAQSTYSPRPAAAKSNRAESPDACRRCTSCSRLQASVLLLPCSHLCLCRDCSPKVGACPVCGAGKNASIHVSTP